MKESLIGVDDTYTGWFTEITIEESIVSNSIFSGPPCICETSI